MEPEGEAGVSKNVFFIYKFWFDFLSFVLWFYWEFGLGAVEICVLYASSELSD